MATFKSFNPAISQPQSQPGQAVQPGQTGQNGAATSTPSRVPQLKQYQLRQAPGGTGNVVMVPAEVINTSAGVTNPSVGKKTLKQVLVQVGQRQQRDPRSERRGIKGKSDKKDDEQEWSLLDSPVETVARHAPAMFNPAALLEDKLGHSREQDREAREELQKKLAGMPVLDSIATLLRAALDIERKQQQGNLSAADLRKTGKVRNSITQVSSSLIRDRMPQIREIFQRIVETAEVADPSLEPQRGVRRQMRIIVGAARDSDVETELSVAVMGRALQRHAPDCFIEMADVICSQMVGTTLNQENLRKNPVRNRGAYALAISDSKCFMQLRSTWSVATVLLLNLSALGADQPKLPQAATAA